MKKLFSHFLKKSLLAVTVLGIAIGSTLGVKAWWPNRPTFTVANPAPYVTFNSITDNPNYGNELTFFDAKDSVNTAAGGYAGAVKVHDGEQVLMRVYVHNNAASNLNNPNNTGSGVAHNTQVRVEVPTATAQALRANAFVSASNANPQVVSDTLDLSGDQNFSLSYVPGSAVTYNNAHPTGMALSDTIATTGAPIGFNQPDGNVPGCFEFVNIVTLKVIVKMPTPAYKVTKQVALPGGQWSKNVTAQPGSQVNFEVGFTNTGNTQLDNVIIRDQLPKHLNIVPGSTVIYNPNNPNGVNAGTDAITSNGGIDIGKYGAGSNAYVIFKTTVDNTDKLECGTSVLTNIAEASQGSNAPVTDTATVTVNNSTCTTTTPSFKCTLLGVQTIGGREIKATVNSEAINGATVKNYTYDFGDGTTPLVTDQNPVTYTYAKDGNFVVRVTVSFLVNGQTQSATSDQCAKPVSFTTGTPPPTTPTALPNTGAGSIFGLFTGVTIAGAVAHRLFMSRRVTR